MCLCVFHWIFYILNVNGEIIVQTNWQIKTENLVVSHSDKLRAIQDQFENVRGYIQTY